VRWTNYNTPPKLETARGLSKGDRNKMKLSKMIIDENGQPTWIDIDNQPILTSQDGNGTLRMF
jgi:hypothetical protein